MQSLSLSLSLSLTHTHTHTHFAKSARKVSIRQATSLTNQHYGLVLMPNGNFYPQKSVFKRQLFLVM